MLTCIVKLSLSGNCDSLFSVHPSETASSRKKCRVGFDFVHREQIGLLLVANSCDVNVNVFCFVC